MVRKRLAQHVTEGGMLPHGILKPSLAFRKGRMCCQQPHEVAVWGIPLLEEQAVILVVARGIDTAIERLRLLAGKLESKTSANKTRVTNLVGKLPGEEALKGERLAFDVVPPRRLRARDRHVRRALNRLDTKPLRDTHVRRLGEQVEPYRGDTGAKAIFALVGLR